MTIQAPPLPPHKPTNYNQSSPTLPTSNTPSTTPQTPTANNTPPPPPRPKLANLFSRLTNDNNFTFHHLHLTRDDLQLSEHLKKLNFSAIQHILQFYDFSVHRFVVLPVTCHLPIDQLIGHPMYKHHSLSHLSGAIEPFQNGGQLLDHYLVYPNKQIPDQLMSNAKKNEQGLFTIESIYQAESSREKGQFEYLFEKSNDDNTCHLMSTKHIQQRFINLVNIDCPFDYQMRLSKEQGIVNRLNIYGRALKATLDAIHSRKPISTSKPSTPTSTLGRSGSLGGSLGVFVQSKSSSNLKDVTRMDSPRTPTQTSSPSPLLPTGGPKDAEYYDEYYAMTQKLRDADFLSDLDINSFEEVEQFFNILKKQIFATALVKSMYGAKKRVANSVASTQSTSKNDKKSTSESEREVGLLFSSLSFSTMSHTLEQHLVNDLLKNIPELTSISRGTTGSVSEQLARESFFKNVQYFNGCSIDHKLLPVSLREGTFSGDLKWKKVDYFDNFSNETCKLLAEKCKGLTNLNVSGTVFLDTKVVKDVNISQIAPSKIFNESGLMTLADNCKLLSSIEIRMGKWDIKGTNYLLQALPRLTKLSVPGVNMDESTFKAISENRTLKHLLINNCEACNDQNLKFLYNHPTISQLVIQNCTGVQNGILGLVEANAPSLVYLELVNLHNLTDGYLDVSKNTNIKTLKVNHCRTLTTQNIVSLSKTQSAITNLMIRGTTDTIVLSSIGQGYLANQLQVLDLSKTSFPYTQILKSEGPVTAFQPVYYPVTPVATEDYKLIIQACRHLKVLILDCNHNVNDNIIYLLSDQTHPHLERLSLEKTSVTQKGINHIYAHFSSQSSNLAALNLRTRTSGELNMIDNLPNIPKLKEVHLGLIRSHAIAMHYVKKLSMCKALDTVYVEFDSLEAKHKLVENNKLKDIHFEI